MRQLNIIKMKINRKPWTNPFVISFYKRLLKWDYIIVISIIASMMVILVEGFSLNINALNPVKKAFHEFHMTDVFYSMLNDKSAKEMSKDIVLVDIHDITKRGDLAKVIAEVNNYKPKVVMIDILFNLERNTIEDKELVTTICSLPTNVIASRLDKYNVEYQCFSELQHSFFYKDDIIAEGYCNTTNPELGITRNFTFTQKFNDTHVYSLPYITACMYKDIQPKKDCILNERAIEFDPINFLTIKPNEMKRFKQIINNKIVIIGAMNELADEHYTPIGRLSGMEILAYSVNTILKKQNIKEMSKIGIAVLSIFILWIYLAFSSYIFDKWPDDTLLLQPTLFFFVVLIVFLLSFYLFAFHNYYIPLLYPLMALALADNANGFYRWLKKKFIFKFQYLHRILYIIVFLSFYSTMHAQEFVTYSVAGNVYNEKKIRLKPGDILSKNTKIDIRKESAIFIIDKTNNKMYSLKSEGVNPIKKLLEDSNTSIKNLTKVFCRHMLSQIINHNNSEKDQNYLSGAAVVYRADKNNTKLFNRIMKCIKITNHKKLTDYQYLMIDSCEISTDFNVSFSISEAVDGKCFFTIQNSTNRMLYVNILHINDGGEKKIIFPVDNSLTGIGNIIPAKCTIAFNEYEYSYDSFKKNLFLLVASEEMIDFTSLLSPIVADGNEEMKLGLKRIIINRDEK